MSNNPDAAPKLSDGQLELLFRRLNLANTRRIYQEVAHRAEKENWAYRDFLALLLAEEGRTASKLACNALPAKLTFRFSRPLMSLTLVYKLACASRYSVRTWDRISSLRDAP